MPRAAASSGETSQMAEMSTKKVHMMPAPTADPREKMQLMPPPARFGISNGNAQSVSFNNIIYIAAQRASNLSEDIAGQTKEICERLDHLLKQSKSDKTKIVRADMFVKEKNDFKTMIKVWDEWIGDAKYAPVIAPAIVKDFIIDGTLVEITVVANICKGYDEVDE